MPSPLKKIHLIFPGQRCIYFLSLTICPLGSKRASFSPQFQFAQLEGTFLFQTRLNTRMEFRAPRRLTRWQSWAPEWQEPSEDLQRRQDTTVPDPHSHRLLPHHSNDTQGHTCSLAYKTNSFHYHVFFISSKYTNQESGLKLLSKLDNNENWK